MDEKEPGAISPTALDHASRPRNLGRVRDIDGHARVTGPCGETMEIWITVRDWAVAAASFVTDGCGASLACGSMATTLAEGKTLEDAACLEPQDILDALGGLPPEHVHCAVLAADTLRAACEEYFMKHKNDETPDSRGKTANCETCGDADCAAARRKEGESAEEFEDRRKLQSRLCRIGSKIIVLSGKGGVGKSTVAVNLAASLALSGKRVGLLDVDIHGPSIPTMLGLEGAVIRSDGDAMIPIDWGDMKVMSLGFLLKNPDDAVIWRGPMKMNVIRQFLKDVAWGELDFLIIDSPPGTGDEPLSVCQLIGRLDGAVIVTTPQKVAAVDVRKSITFCRQLHVPVLGVIENMSGFACPKCGEVTAILPAGGGKRIAADMEVPFLGSIPLDPKIAEAGDAGRDFLRYFASSPSAEIMRTILRSIADSLSEPGRNPRGIPTTF